MYEYDRRVFIEISGLQIKLTTYEQAENNYLRGLKELTDRIEKTKIAVKETITYKKRFFIFLYKIARGLAKAEITL